MNLSLKAKILTAFTALATVTAGIGIFALYSNYSSSVEFVNGSSADTQLIKHIASIETEFGLMIQDWKNTLLRGGDPVAFEKHSKNFDGSVEKIYVLAKALKDKVEKEDVKVVEDFLEKFKAVEAKYKDARSANFSSTVFEPGKADKAVHGIDRELLDGVRGIADKTTKESVEAEKTMLASMRKSIWFATGLISGIALVLLVAVAILLGRVFKTLNLAVASISEIASTVSGASGEIASSSQRLSQSATEQAASLEQTAASIEEMSSMVNKNSENSKVAAKVSTDSLQSANRGKSSVEDMIRSMDEINASNNQIVEIVKVIQQIDNKTKVINDIVFQTKLLSFNASVEAARAGEHGKGFAVVAEEVGNLAQMSGSAAEEISALLENSIQKVEGIVNETKTKVESGARTARSCGEVLDAIVKTVSSVSEMAGEISNASHEQAQGVQEITKAMTQLDQVTQQNAATSEQAASASEELSAQAQSLNDIVRTLVKIVDGKDQVERPSTVKKVLAPDEVMKPTADVIQFPKKGTEKTGKQVVNGNMPDSADSRFKEV